MLTVVDLDLAANAAQILSVVIPIFAGFFAWKRTLDRRDAEQAKRIERVSIKLDLIEKQFGPNGGGLREAVNRISAAVEKMDERMMDLMKEHAELVGHVKSCPVVMKRGNTG